MSTMKLNVKSDGIEFGTNILKIKVPKQLRNKVKCGVDYIDSALGGGGFTPSAVTFFTGTPGSGKTTMMLKMADQLTKQGAIVVFNTAEESLFQIKLVAERLKLQHGFHAGQETSVPDLLEYCDTLRNKRGNKNKPFFLIVDSLQRIRFLARVGAGHPLVLAEDLLLSSVPGLRVLHRFAKRLLHLLSIRERLGWVTHRFELLVKSAAWLCDRPV